MRKDEFPIVDMFVKNSINEVLDKIKAEIQKVIDGEQEFKSENARAQTIALYWCLEIIDKYKQEISDV